jgi:hypothetical protein
METLQRDNNLLQERLGSLMDCGITPSNSTLEAYSQSKQKDAFLLHDSSVLGRGAGASPLLVEAEFMRVRIQRLEAALALEMKAREALEDTCAAQKKVIVHRLAALSPNNS